MTEPTPPFDPALLDEPDYALALDTLLHALDAGRPGAYDAIAQRFPRYAAPLLEAALIALPHERPLSRNPPDLVRETSVFYDTRQAVSDGIALARHTLDNRS